MQIHPTVRPWEVCAKPEPDAARPTLESIHLQPDGTARATDGHIAVVLPSYADDVDAIEPVLLPAAALRQAIRAAKPNGSVSATLADDTLTVHPGRGGLETRVPCAPNPGKFPSFGNIIPTCPPETAALRIGINTKFLARLAASLGIQRLELRIPSASCERGQAAGPILVLPMPGPDSATIPLPGAHGVIMPITLDT